MNAIYSKNKSHSKIKTPLPTVVFNVIGYVVLTIASLFCLIPFVMLISSSFSSEKSIALQGYSLWPHEFSTAAYDMIFKVPMTVIRAYGVSIYVTATGTLLGLLIISMTAYVLSRKYFKYRFQVTFFFYFTTLFSGGLLSVYIFFIRYLNLKNSLIALILPMIVNVFYLLIMRTFIAEIPSSISESAKIDGAGEFRIYTTLILPLSGPALATIGLFLAIGYWNDWYHAMLYISEHQKYPLQYMLYNMLSAAEAMSRIARESSVVMADVPSRAVRLAMTVIATGPILLVYPFVQKYFVKGVTIGAVKG